MTNEPEMSRQDRETVLTILSWTILFIMAFTSLLGWDYIHYGHAKEVPTYEHPDYVSCLEKGFPEASELWSSRDGKITCVDHVNNRYIDHYGVDPRNWTMTFPCTIWIARLTNEKCN